MVQVPFEHDGSKSQWEENHQNSLFPFPPESSQGVETAGGKSCQMYCEAFSMS